MVHYPFCQGRIHDSRVKLKILLLLVIINWSQSRRCPVEMGPTGTYCKNTSCSEINVICGNSEEAIMAQEKQQQALGWVSSEWSTCPSTRHTFTFNELWHNDWPADYHLDCCHRRAYFGHHEQEQHQEACHGAAGLPIASSHATEWKVVSPFQVVWYFLENRAGRTEAMQDSIICSGFTPAKAPMVVESVQGLCTNLS